MKKLTIIHSVIIFLLLLATGYLIYVNNQQQNVFKEYRLDNDNQINMLKDSLSKTNKELQLCRKKIRDNEYDINTLMDWAEDFDNWSREVVRWSRQF